MSDSSPDAWLHPPHRIVLTGGPGGGKTTAADLFRREIGKRIVVVPETATLLFSGGFPRVDDIDAVRATQRAIYHTQRALEDVHTLLYPRRVLLCDRGTMDGAAYWPDDVDAYFASFDTTPQAELARYDAVLFFETAAAGGTRIEGGNRIRTESNERAIELDARLRAVWRTHPRFSLIPHTSSFLKKLEHGIRALSEVLEELDGAIG